ncbi:MAG: DNA photolyase [Deltaproteobacteria bacterium]|nr:DNA photolyase [Deltaproteobacteria bacterium]
MTLAKRIRRILVEEPAQDYPMTERVLARLPGVPVTVIPQREVLRPLEHQRSSWLPESKTTLLLAVQKGPFRRPCPGTKDYICCGYQVLQVALNCTMDCTYCVLQSYVNIPAVTVFVNVADLFQELEQECNAAPDRVWRVGTGEFGDSLALDELVGINEELIPFFAGNPRAVLEIKTKWRRLEHLLHLGPNSQVIFAWSLNPEEIVREEEKFAAPLKARLQAAAQAAAAGFRLAFHFDPIVYFPGWEEAYRHTVGLLGERIPPASIAWISLGALRFLPAQRRLILERFPSSRIAAQEMVRAPDGKLRYFKGLRQELYCRLREWLAEAAPGALVYLCMESPRLWDAVFGFHPGEEELARRLDARALNLPAPTD